MYVSSSSSFVDNAPQISFDLAESSATTATHFTTLSDGESLFRDGDEADYVYEVAEGVLRSSKVLFDGRRQVLSFAYPGDMVGLSHDNEYHSDCDALGKVKLRVYRKNAFNKTFQQDPSLCAMLLNRAAQEMKEMQEHFLMLGRKSATEKIASFLLTLYKKEKAARAGASCFTLPMSRSDIADFLGLTIETVSRTLSKLKRQKLISLPTPNRVCVLDQSRLNELAEAED